MSLQKFQLCLGFGLLCACGPGFSDAPFANGSVSGGLSGADASSALVFVLGSPELRATVGVDGRFSIDRVPIGYRELIALAGNGKAARVPVRVASGQRTELGAIQPLPAGRILAVVRPANAGSPHGVSARVEGTVFSGQIAGGSGVVALGPLPDGCYQVSAAKRGYKAQLQEVCLSQGGNQVHLLALSIDSEAAQPGCAASSCPTGLTCEQASGKCSECDMLRPCANGLICADGACTGELKPCQTCTHAAQCGPGGACELTPWGEMHCLYRCDGPRVCPEGYACDSGLCRPEANLAARCVGFAGFGTTCAGSQECGSRGIVRPVCESFVCTALCESEFGCPPGYSCDINVAAGFSTGVCRPDP